MFQYVSILMDMNHRYYRNTLGMAYVSLCFYPDGHES